MSSYVLVDRFTQSVSIRYLQTIYLVGPSPIYFIDYVLLKASVMSIL